MLLLPSAAWKSNCFCITEYQCSQRGKILHKSITQKACQITQSISEKKFNIQKVHQNFPANQRSKIFAYTYSYLEVCHVLCPILGHVRNAELYILLQSFQAPIQSTVPKILPADAFSRGVPMLTDIFRGITVISSFKCPV